MHRPRAALLPEKMGKKHKKKAPSKKKKAKSPRPAVSSASVQVPPVVPEETIVPPNNESTVEVTPCKELVVADKGNRNTLGTTLRRGMDAFLDHLHLRTSPSAKRRDIRQPTQRDPLSANSSMLEDDNKSMASSYRTANSAVVSPCTSSVLDSLTRSPISQQNSPGSGSLSKSAKKKLRLKRRKLEKAMAAASNDTPVNTGTLSPSRRALFMEMQLRTPAKLGGLTEIAGDIRLTASQDGCLSISDVLDDFCAADTSDAQRAIDLQLINDCIESMPEYLYRVCYRRDLIVSGLVDVMKTSSHSSNEALQAQILRFLACEEKDNMQGDTSDPRSALDYLWTLMNNNGGQHDHVLNLLEALLSHGPKSTEDWFRLVDVVKNGALLSTTKTTGVGHVSRCEQVRDLSPLVLKTCISEASIQCNVSPTPSDPEHVTGNTVQKEDEDLVTANKTDSLVLGTVAPLPPIKLRPRSLSRGRATHAALIPPNERRRMPVQSSLPVRKVGAVRDKQPVVSRTPQKSNLVPTPKPSSRLSTGKPAAVQPPKRPVLVVPPVGANGTSPSEPVPSADEVEMVALTSPPVSGNLCAKCSSVLPGASAPPTSGNVPPAPPPPPANLFGNVPAAPPPPPANLFGNVPTAPPPPPANVFGNVPAAPPPPPANLLGKVPPAPPPPPANLLVTVPAAPPPPPGGLCKGGPPAPPLPPPLFAPAAVVKSEEFYPKSKKTYTVLWETVNHHAIQNANTVWNDYSKPDFDPEDRDEVERIFERVPVKPKPTKTSGKEEKPAEETGPQLGHSRAMQLEILLAKLRPLSVAEFVSNLEGGQAMPPLGVLQGVFNSYPTEDEMALFVDVDRILIKRKCEELCWEAAQKPSLKVRFELAIAKETVMPEVKQQVAVVEGLRQACGAVKTEVLIQLLHRSLQTGNYLNQGTSLSRAAGFKLKSLPEFLSMKGKGAFSSSKCVDIVAKNINLKEVNVQNTIDKLNTFKSSKIGDVETAATELSRTISRLKNQLLRDSNEDLREAYSTFIDEVDEACASLSNDVMQLREKELELKKYFCCSDKDRIEDMGCLIAESLALLLDAKKKRATFRRRSNSARETGSPVVVPSALTSSSLRREGSRRFAARKRLSAEEMSKLFLDAQK